MEASARETGLRERTSEDNLDMKGLKRVRHAGDESSDGEESEEDDEDKGSDASGNFGEALLEGLDLDGGSAARVHVEDAERAALEAEFEAVSGC